MINNTIPSLGGVISFTSCKNDVVALTKDLPIQILDANPNRLYASFVINSIFPVTLFLGDRNSGNIEKGIPLNSGGTFEINLSNLYRGKISAICSGNGKISWVECSE